MNTLNNNKGRFKDQLSEELEQFLEEQYFKYPSHELLKIDLHCHDHNSDKPDELLGRILNVPETWLPSEKLMEVLLRNGCEALTITNHNNARSCYEMQEQGYDVLNASEFTCSIPEYGFFIHVLTYGFTREQEVELNELRRDLYAFLAYCKQHRIPTIWAHPLYNYYAKKAPDMDFFFKLSLVFERFELINGQRETWQNLLVRRWIGALTPEKINGLAERYGINPHLYCHDPYVKNFSGGSDSHMGIFSGLSGTFLHVPNLEKRRIETPLSQLALEAIRAGRMVPYGQYTRHEKLTIAFLDYFCQIAMHHSEPGLMRILFHKGTSREKVLALAISNAFTELRHHKVTMSFVKMFHQAIMGKAPNFTKKYFISKAYKPVFDDIIQLSKVTHEHNKYPDKAYHKIVMGMADKLNHLFFSRLEHKLAKFNQQFDAESFDFNNIFSQFELSSDIRTYLGKSEPSNAPSNQLDVNQLLDGLSFPLLSSAIILAANYTGAKVLFNHRSLLNDFSEHVGQLQHPQRMLWMTDTFNDQNGVSTVLQSIHQEIKERDLPIDLLVCSKDIEPDDHLIVVPPVAEFSHPVYKEQSIRVPSFVEVHKLFDRNEYDRVMCSTEGPMGLMALYLKSAFSVKAHFYVHTDWIMFARKVLNLNTANLSRFRRVLRAFYKGYDHLFVLNEDHRKWLTGSGMGFKPNQVSVTAHWVNDHFMPMHVEKDQVFEVEEREKVILYVGRMSKEKGLLELPEVFEKIKRHVDNVKMIFVGSGPAERELMELMPDAQFINWKNNEDLPSVYNAADVLLFPSKFDTFSCVVLEAMTCGLPVIAYNSKGPKDIIEHGKSGYLVKNRQEMAQCAVKHLTNIKAQKKMSALAIERAQDYNKSQIINQLVNELGLETAGVPSVEWVD